MNQQTSSSTRMRAVALAFMALGASAAMAQAGNNAAPNNGVTNLSAPQSAAQAAPATSAVPAGTSAAAVRAAVTQTSAPSNASLTPPATNRVGDSTNYLLALQASGQYASRNAHPVTSDVAQRTYQRYLESFTHKIPESSETQVSSKSGGSR